MDSDQTLIFCNILLLANQTAINGLNLIDLLARILMLTGSSALQAPAQTVESGWICYELKWHFGANWQSGTSKFPIQTRVIRLQNWLRECEMRLQRVKFISRCVLRLPPILLRELSNWLKSDSLRWKSDKLLITSLKSLKIFNRNANEGFSRYQLMFKLLMEVSLHLKEFNHLLQSGNIVSVYY